MLSVLTQPNYPKAAIGLENGSIAVVGLQREGRGRFAIKQAAVVELPVNLLVPSFIDRNIASKREFGVLLQEAAVTAGLAKQTKWSVSLPSGTARSAILTLENAIKDDSEEILDWKAEQSFGAPSGDLRITREKIAPDREGRSRYFATAVKLSVIDEYETVFEGLGWQAGLMLPRALSETKWLQDGASPTDSMLISSQADGFTAFLMRGGQPAVVRSVTCRSEETDDEIYRLLMYYHDRFSEPNGGTFLERLLLVGKSLVPSKVREISAEALGYTLQILKPEEVGLNMPVSNIRFDDVAAPAGLATLGWR
jgi:hypothetical protein